MLHNFSVGMLPLCFYLVNKLSYYDVNKINQLNSFHNIKVKTSISNENA